MDVDVVVGNEDENKIDETMSPHLTMKMMKNQYQTNHID
jgi:hypothetical protein